MLSCRDRRAVTSRGGSRRASPSLRALGLAALLVLGPLAAPVHAIPVDRLVTVQPIRVVSDDAATGAQVGFFERETDKIWSQAGIDIDFLDVVSLAASRFLLLDEVSEILELFNKPGHGQHADARVVNLWFVDTIITDRTFGIALVGGNGIAIGAAAFPDDDGAGRLDTIAHELGHNLGLPHPPEADPVNLMTEGGPRVVPGSIDDIAPDGAALDRLTAAQIAAARDSPFALPSVTAVSEPAAWTELLLALAVATAIVIRRRRSARQSSDVAARAWRR